MQPKYIEQRMDDSTNRPVKVRSATLGGQVWRC